jgi:hypothetical protein
MSQESGPKKPPLPQLVNTRKAAEILARSPATLKRWRYEGVGPNWIEIEGRVSAVVFTRTAYKLFDRAKPTWIQDHRKKNGNLDSNFGQTSAGGLSCPFF